MEQAAQTLTALRILLSDRKPLHSVKMFHFHGERDNCTCQNQPDMPTLFCAGKASVCRNALEKYMILVYS